MIDLNGKVVLVTGAAGGIGAATVAKVAQLGGAAIAHDLREPAAGDLRLSGDLREPEAARALWERAWAWRDGIDVLVNCAGIYAPAAVEADFADWTASWRRTLDINLLAPAVLCREAIVSFRGRGGGIIATGATIDINGASYVR
jgi:3-oxoacyl-[acyl-carrier protein] reductase